MKTPIQCQFGEAVNEQCKQTATVKWGDYFFCNEHAGQRRTQARAMLPNLSFPTLPALVALLRTLRPCRRETDFQAAICTLLTNHGIEYEAEFRLDARTRFDFLVRVEGSAPLVCIETKVLHAAGGATDRQLQRYALTGAIDHIILLTCKPMTLASNEYRLGNGVIRIDNIDISQNALL